MWQCPERGVRVRERNSSADINAGEEGRGEGATGARAEISLQSIVRTMLAQVDAQRRSWPLWLLTGPVALWTEEPTP